MKFLKESRQSVVKELLKDREESILYVKTEKTLAMVRLSGKRPYDDKLMVSFMDEMQMPSIPSHLTIFWEHIKTVSVTAVEEVGVRKTKNSLIVMN